MTSALILILKGWANLIVLLNLNLKFTLITHLSLTLSFNHETISNNFYRSPPMFHNISYKGPREIL